MSLSVCYISSGQETRILIILEQRSGTASQPTYLIVSSGRPRENSFTSPRLPSQTPAVAVLAVHSRLTSPSAQLGDLFQLYASLP